MKYTNKLGLPQYLVDWLTTDNYDYDNTPNSYSTTTLLKPLRAKVLTKRHGDKLQMDVSELIASRYGNAIHDSIERINSLGVQKEIRVTRKITIEDTEFTVTGKFDILVQEDDHFVLRDIKTTSVWTKIYGGKDDDYRMQLSIYRWLLSPTYNVSPTAFIDFFFTDWQASKARTEDNYPSHRIAPGHKIDLLSNEDIEEVIRNKLKEIKDNQHTPDDKLPLCSKEELWSEDDTWAVFKVGGKRALKVCASKEEAEGYKEEKSANGYVQHRPGKVKRCKYCPAAPFCSQFKKLQEYGLVQTW